MPGRTLTLGAHAARRATLGMPAGYSARRALPDTERCPAAAAAADAASVATLGIGVAAASATHATLTHATHAERRRGIRTESRADRSA